MSAHAGRYWVPAIFLAAIFYLLYQVHHVLLPFVLAATLAYLLNPLVAFLEVRGLRRRLAVWIVFLGFMGALALAAYAALSMAAGEASRLSADWPRFAERFKAVAGAFHALAARFPFLESWMNSLHADTALAPLREQSPTLALSAFPLVELTTLVPFLALFFMLDGLAARNAVLELVPPRYVEMLLSLLVEADHSLGNYLRGLCAQALFMGLLAGLGFWMIGLHYAVQIACWVALTSMIPLIGAVSAALAGCLVALVQWGSVAGIAKVLVVCTAIRLLDDWLLSPLILRKAIRVHPAITVFSLMAGGSLFGFWGLLFAVPVVCMTKVFLEVIWDWYRAEYGLRRDSLPVEVSHIPLI